MRLDDLTVDEAVDRSKRFAKKHNDWVNAEDGKTKNKPKEGALCLFLLKAGAKLRTEIKIHHGEPDRRTLAVDFLAYGYRYGKNRVYLPMYRVSTEYDSAILGYSLNELHSIYFNGFGRDGEQILLNTEND